MLRLVDANHVVHFTEDHLWLRNEGQCVRLGLTPFGVGCLGGIVHVHLIAAGTQVTAGTAMGFVESHKAVMDLTCPVSGVVLAANEDIARGRRVLDVDPYGAGWLYAIAPADPDACVRLMTWEQYKEGRELARSAG